MNTFIKTIGNAEVILLSEGQNRGNSSILIGATPEMFREYAPDSTYPNAVNAFLVRLPEHTILVDAGFGQQLFQNMESVGVTVEQIGIIALTHLHGDHIGGMLRDGAPVFPNAEVYLSQAEYDYWTNDEAMDSLPENRRGGFTAARKVLEAYKDRLHLIRVQDIGESPEALVPDFYAIAAYGHTPGHTMYMVTSQTSSLLLWGDVTHAMAIQMPYPEVSVTYDTDPEQAAATRQKILEYVTQYHIPVAGAHIAYPATGTVIGNNYGGYLFQPDNMKKKVQHAIRMQLKTYPESRLQDIYKSFFQDYFGPGHLIVDTLSASNYLREELKSYTKPEGILFEPTGWEGNFYRLNLSLLKEKKIPYSVFFDAFVRSAQHAATPPFEVWHTQWNEIMQIIEDMRLNLPNYKEDLNTLTAMFASGYYAVHHSTSFNNLYNPHYRVISKDILHNELKDYLK